MKQRLRAILDEKRLAYEPESFSLGTVEVAPTRNALLKFLYGAGVVEASPFSGHLADKLFFARCMEELLPGDDFHPRTLSLREFLAEPQVFAPTGFVVKATGGINSDGKDILAGEEFFAAWEKSPDVFLGEKGAACPLSGLVSSGERYLAQEKIGNREQEYRLHTLEGRVVRGATFTRWDQSWDLAAFRRAEDALQAFLDRLPPWFVARQAWSVDLIESERFRLVEVNTNRGKAIHWSGDLSIPDTLQAYVLHLEEYYGARFLGEGGELFRKGEANRHKFLEKFGPEAVARHEALKAGKKA